MAAAASGGIMEGGQPVWAGKDVLSVEQFDKASLDDLYRATDYYKAVVREKGGCDALKGRVLANIFYENSTRTSASFAAAMERLGGSVLQLAVGTSSVKKGESLSDTIRCLEQYADVLVLRHGTKGSAAEAAAAAESPLLNAGDGTGEHPTQALLDLYTIYSERKGGVDGITVTMLGDLKNGRTVHSLSALLSLFNVKLNYVSPESLGMPSEVTEKVAAAGIEQTVPAALEEVIPSTDVLYVTRIQRERFATPEEYEAVKGAYVVTPELLAMAKSDLVVMHPLPRVDEIDVRCDVDPRAAYFRQMENGLFVRMALLALVLGVQEHQHPTPSEPASSEPAASEPAASPAAVAPMVTTAVSVAPPASFSAGNLAVTAAVAAAVAVGVVFAMRKL